MPWARLRSSWIVSLTFSLRGGWGDDESGLSFFGASGIDGVSYQSRELREVKRLGALPKR